MAVSKNYLKAGNPETPVEQLRALILDECRRVRRRVAENPSTPVDLLTLLAGDEDAEVRIAVGANANCPEELKEQLARDPSVEVRYSLAGLYSMPLHVLEFLAADENPYISDLAKRTIEGVHLELTLKEIGFVPTPGDKDKLGELLVEAGIINVNEIDELLRLSHERGYPLGRTIVMLKKLPRSVVVTALKAQLKLRDQSLEHNLAIQQILVAHNAEKRSNS